MTNKRFEYKYINMEFEPFQKKVIYDSETGKEYDCSFESQEDLCNLLNNFIDTIGRLNQSNCFTFKLIDDLIEKADDYRTPISKISYGDDIGYWNGVYQQLKELKRMLEESQNSNGRFIFDHKVNRDWKTPIVDTTGGKMNIGEVLDTLNSLSNELSELSDKESGSECKLEGISNNLTFDNESDIWDTWELIKPVANMILWNWGLKLVGMEQPYNLTCFDTEKFEKKLLETIKNNKMV